jgi:uncharacterized protein YwgA
MYMYIPSNVCKILHHLVDEKYLKDYENNHESRLIVQKVFYIFLNLHNDLWLYNYTWYVKGPYSSGLSNQINDIIESENMLKVDNEPLTEEQQSEIDKVIDFLKLSFDCDEVLKHQILASLLYLYDEGYKEDIIDKLLDKQPDLRPHKDLIEKIFNEKKERILINERN